MAERDEAQSSYLCLIDIHLDIPDKMESGIPNGAAGTTKNQH